MDEKKRQLRRTAAEEFMRSLEQLGELLSDEEPLPLSNTKADEDSDADATTEASTRATNGAVSPSADVKRTSAQDTDDQAGFNFLNDSLSGLFQPSDSE